MKKKKKKVTDFLWFSNYIPGISLTNSSIIPSYTDHQGYQYSYTRTIPGPPMGYLDSRMKGAGEAWWEYTFSGPVELMAAKSAGQAGALTALGTYSSFRAGVMIELGMDFAIIGAVLTITDPANKWEGGLDEWGFLGGNQQQSLPGTMSAEEGTAALWGFKQGHLGKLMFG